MWLICNFHSENRWVSCRTSAEQQAAAVSSCCVALDKLLTEAPGRKWWVCRNVVLQKQLQADIFKNKNFQQTRVNTDPHKFYAHEDFKYHFTSLTMQTENLFISVQELLKILCINLLLNQTKGMKLIKVQLQFVLDFLRFLVCHKKLFKVIRKRLN